MHEWVKDYQRIQSEIEVLDYQINNDVSVTGDITKQAVMDGLNVILNETNKKLIKKEDQIQALKEVATMFTGVEHEIFVKRHIENKLSGVIAHELGVSISYVDSINSELLNLLEFYSEYN